MLNAARLGLGVLVMAGIFGGMVSCKESSTAAAEPTPEQRVARGRYLVRVAGCNDCHTPGFMQQGEKVPEEKWLTGVPMGWRGPWGTTYASNLRKAAAMYPETQFVQIMKSAKGGTGRPPMPWASLAAMTDEDLGTIHAYIRSLGDAGEATPIALPPDKEPETPYLDMMPKNLPKK